MSSAEVTLQTRGRSAPVEDEVTWRGSTEERKIAPLLIPVDGGQSVCDCVRVCVCAQNAVDTADDILPSTTSSDTFYLYDTHALKKCIISSGVLSSSLFNLNWFLIVPT